MLEKLIKKRKGFTPLDSKHLTGFTLLELLVVVALIVILAAFLIPALDRARERAQIAATETMISNLRLAISMFETDTGVLPALTHPGLHTNLTTSGPLGWNGPYMEFKAEDLRPITGGQEIIDFWGSAYSLSTTPPTPPITTPPTPPPPAGHRVYIWSWGPNRVNNTGGVDDITSWR
jgi:prepilin-type N-terminal cleavage/methylation domain-containing protein